MDIYNLSMKTNTLKLKKNIHNNEYQELSLANRKMRGGEAIATRAINVLSNCIPGNCVK